MRMISPKSAGMGNSGSSQKGVKSSEMCTVKLYHDEHTLIMHMRALCLGQRHLGTNNITSRSKRVQNHSSKVNVSNHCGYMYVRTSRKNEKLHLSLERALHIFPALLVRALIILVIRQVRAFRPRDMSKVSLEMGFWRELTVCSYLQVCSYRHYSPLQDAPQAPHTTWPLPS